MNTGNRRALNLRAGSESELRIDSGDWAFVDIGFSSTSKSCGFLQKEGSAEVLTFGDLKSKLIGLAEIGGPPLNIVIEAPLSISFNKKGNPAGRSFEKSEKGSRYWYTNGGCVVMVSAGYLLRALLETVPAREIRLFEAFVSFKPKDKKSSHLEDVLAMREAVKKSKEPGIVVNHYEIAQKNHVVQSAFVAWGFDLGVPPVLKA